MANGINPVNSFNSSAISNVTPSLYSGLNSTGSLTAAAGGDQLKLGSEAGDMLTGLNTTSTSSSTASSSLAGLGGGDGTTNYIMSMVNQLNTSMNQTMQKLMSSVSSSSTGSTGTTGTTTDGVKTASVDGKSGTVTVNYKHSGVMPAQASGNHTWVNKCPFCGGSLLCNPKKTAEGELTCGKCDADFDGNTGYDKTYHPRAKLTEVKNTST